MWLHTRSLFAQTGAEELGLGPAVVPQLSSGSPAIPADTAEPPSLSLIIFYCPLVPFLDFWHKLPAGLRFMAPQLPWGTRPPKGRGLCLKSLNQSKPSFIFLSYFCYNQPRDLLKAIERLKNIEGLEASWQNFFQWTAEQEGQSQPPV